ncbi:MAG: FecR family protein, partial [Proteobacteria bacterium]|nr:FecR family protein [Pseudomonadota bacterium]
EVARAQQKVEGHLAGESRLLSRDSLIFLNDSVETGPASRAELALTDQSRLILGEEAQIVIDEFVAGSGGSTVFKILRGALRYTSGLATPSHGIALVTPVATIGIRGTDFWFGPIEGAFGVVLLDGIVEVTNQAGTVVLDEPGEGTLIFGANIAPGEPAIWPDDRRARALATVAF